ncbi:MAG: vWA domain-containing protein [Cyclobacteriaceae bacterium]
MSWFRSLGTIELLFVTAFLLFYALYIFRTVRIARQLQTSSNTILVKLLVRTLYFSLIIIALLGPSFGQSQREVSSIGKDIYLLVDLSESMNASDIQPTRLEKVKFELKNIVNAFSSDRLGLIIFSSEAFVQSPLTYDQNALSLFIETLNTNLVPNSGTDFGPPLRVAFEKLTREESTITQPKSKIIILISDGEDFGEETGEVAEQIEEAGIKLFTLGVGTETGSRIRTASGFKKDRQGNEVITRLDDRQLKSLAVETEGKYFEINDRNNDVERMINVINQIEGELRDTRLMDVSANKYYYFIWLALFLMAFDFLFSIKTIRI